MAPNVVTELDDEKGRATMRFTGTVDLQILRDFYLHAEVVSEWMERIGLEAYDGLVDMREAKMGFTLTGVKEIVQMNQDVPKERREAVVASSDLIYGLARLYQILQPRRSICIFRDIEGAESWLDT